MEKTAVRHFMVPLSEYATVSEDATLFEAVLALEKAQQTMDRGRSPYLHRAVLVLDNKNVVVGKIGQLDVLRALEPRSTKMEERKAVSRAGFSPDLLQTVAQEYALLNKPLRDLCTKAANATVRDFMHIPEHGEFIEENSELGIAVNALVMGGYQSLLVTDGENIVGILRLTDVFTFVTEAVKSCDLG